MSQLGKAYVEVLADLKKFPADLRTKLKAALKEGLQGVEFTEFEKKAEAAGARAGDVAGNSFNRRIKKKAEDGGKTGALGFLSGLVKVFDKEKSSKGNFFESVSKLFSSATQEGLKGGAEKLGQLANVGGQIGGALSGIGGQVGSIVQIGALALIIPVVLQLVGAVVQLGAALFALPAAIGVVGAAIAPLVIAFQGFGEAVGAGLSGDVDAFNKALKNLTPSAAAVAKEFVKLKPVFSGLKKAVQESFFNPLVGVVGPALDLFISSITPGLAKVSHALGELGATLLSVISDGDVLGDLNDLFSATARIVENLEQPLGRLFGSFFGLIQTGLPFVERLFGALGRGIDRFADWLAQIQGDGTLSGWLDRAWHILVDLFAIAKEFGDYLVTLFGGEIGDNGTEFLDEFKVKLQELLDYLKSPDGKETIHNLGVLLHWVGEAFLLLFGVESVALLGLNKVFDGVRLLAKGLETLGGWVVTAAKAVAWFFSMLWDAITGAGRAIGNFFTETIPSWWDSVVSFFEGLPGQIMDALGDLRDSGRNFLMDMLTSWYEQFFEWVGNVIGIVLSLPQLIPAAFEVLKTNVWNEITALWQGAVDLFWWGVNGTIAVLNAIPGLVSDALSAIGSFFHDFWFGTVLDIQNVVNTGFNRVIDFFASLPGRVRALGPKLYQAAVDLGHKIGDGLSNIGSFASDVGRKIVNVIKSGINFVINSINRGIAEIDEKLPGVLPRIPQLARGAVVDNPTLALIGEAGPEVVVPLTNPKRAQELAEQSGLLSMLRGGDRGGNTQVIVYLDPSGTIIPMTKVIVRDALDDEADELGYARAA
jgi:hypothetical protein